MRVQSVSSLDMQKYALRAKDLGISEAKVDARMRFSVVRIVDELVFVCFFIFKTHGPVQFSLANTVIGGGILSLPLALKVRVQNGSVLMRILVSIAGLHSASLRSSLSFSCRCTRSTCSWSAPTTRACRPRRPIEVSAAHDELLCYKRASLGRDRAKVLWTRGRHVDRHLHDPVVFWRRHVLRDHRQRLYHAPDPSRTAFFFFSPLKCS